jgi:penicillin-binding protein 1C
MEKRRMLFVFLSLLGMTLIIFLWPLPEAFSVKNVISTRLDDRTGKPLYDVRQSGFEEDGSFVVPKTFRDAIISVEDRTFETNAGFSMKGIARALLKDIQAGKIVQGGSTITQQYVRSILKPKKRGFFYKIYEIFLAVKLTSRMSKEDILNKYVQTAYFGQQAYGLPAAARTYFNKTLENLSLSEAALLAGLLNAPSSLNPFKDLPKSLSRRSLVLRSMLETKRISSVEFEEAEKEPVVLTRGTVSIEAPHFVFWLLGQRPDIREAGGEVRTTLDLHLQRVIEKIVTNHLSKLQEKKVTSAAVVVLDAMKGDILAMVGSADYFDDAHDGAVNVATSPRQPGSALKPFTYALAFTHGMTPATTVSDISTQFFTQEGNPYVPRNYDYEEHGLVRLREALANSFNIPAVKVLQKVGVERLLTLLTRSGISTLSEPPEHYGLALTLGGGEVTLIDLAKAYGIFPRLGETLPLRSLESDPIRKGDRVIDPKVSWLITDILSDNEARASEFGRDGPLSFPFPVAAKTGTTRNSRDNWTIGYTSDVIVGVWVGNADNTPMRDTSGITGAAPIFHDVLLQAIVGKSQKNFHRPSGIIDLEICKFSGMLPTTLCTERTTEHFIQGTQPTSVDRMIVTKRIDERNGLLASETCAQKFVKEETFSDLPQELLPWAREHNIKTPPREYSQLCPSETKGEASTVFMITRPAPEESFKLDPLIPDNQEVVIFEGTSLKESDISWYVDGEHVGDSMSPHFRFRWIPTVGNHIITAGTGSGSPSVRIEVIR